MTSLATQLQSIASLDAARLTSRYGAPVSKSYLFPPKVAAQHDLDAIFSLGQSGFEEISALDPGMEQFEEVLFSESAKKTDRMMLTPTENKNLDVILERCLRRLGKWIGIMAGGKCIEWLVRRFRIHEMNVETVLQVFLPYHDSPNFARMLAILTIPQTSIYHAPFSSLVKDSQPVSRTYIANSISPTRDKSLRLLRDISGMLRQALQDGVAHRALSGFWTATLTELLENSRASRQSLSDGTVKVLVEACVEVMRFKGAGQDANAAVYPPLLLLCRTVRLADEPFLAILEALITPDSGANPSHRVLTLMVLLEDRKALTGGMGEKAGANLSRIEKLGQILIAATEKYSLSSALTIIVSSLVHDIEGNFSALSELADWFDMPTTVIEGMTAQLLLLGSKMDCPPVQKQHCEALLSNLSERHPAIVDNTFRELSTSHQIDGSLIKRVTTDDALINVYSADVSARIKAIKDLKELLLSPISSESDPSADTTSAFKALVDLLGDSNPEVLGAVYDALSVVIDQMDIPSYVKVVRPAFQGLSPDKIIIRKHLDFISNHLTGPDQDDLLFQQLLFPCLLVHRARDIFDQKIKFSFPLDSKKNSHLLQAMTTAFKNIPGSPRPVQAETINLFIFKAIAEAMVASDNFDRHLDFLFSQLKATAAESRLLSILILTRLVHDLRGEHQVSIAVRVLRDAPLSFAASTRQFDNSEQPFAPELLSLIVNKYDSPRTTQRAISGMIAATKNVELPSSSGLTWLGEQRKDAPTTTYGAYARSLYNTANGRNLPPTLAKGLLRHLFTQVADQSLLFLASVWTSSDLSSIRVAALTHARAFIDAATSPDGSSTTDFQVIVPAILLAVQDQAKEIREAAVELLSSVKRSQPLSAASNIEIYALDNIYGLRSNMIQLLKQSDLRQYLDMLLNASKELIMDHKRLVVLHASQPGSEGNKKEIIRHKRSVISWLLSHLTAWRSYRERLALLSTLSGINDGGVFRGSLPLLKSLIEPANEERAWVESLDQSQRTAYLETLTRCISQSALPSLSDPESDGWIFLLSALTMTHDADVGRSVRFLTLQRVAGGVFKGLPSELKRVYFTEIIRSSLKLVGNDDPRPSLQILRSLHLEPDDLSAVINKLGDRFEMPTTRKKMADIDSSSAQVDEAVSELTVLFDSRDWSTLPGNVSLVAALMGTLWNLLTKKQLIKEGIDYLEQELLGAILAIVSKITDPVELQRSNVGIEVIIKVIRASNNPRTSERALLIASELARLIPDAVLHNTMPIFTFMGASDFQRDDAYTFGVVEKTVSSIVPVMIRSLRLKASSRLELYTEASSFLSIFTDMSGRLPKHRTLAFFVHLVTSLGAEDFLAPVGMLLAEKANKGGRSFSSQVLELPLNIAAAFDQSTRLEALKEIMDEILRLLDDLTPSDNPKKAFLNRLPSDQPLDPLRSIPLLLASVAGITKQLIGKSCDQSIVERVVEQLVVVSGKVATPLLAETDLDKLSRKALDAVMQLLSASNFFDVTVKLLSGGDTKVQRVALDILVERLPLVKPEIRSKSIISMAEVINHTSNLLNSSSGNTSLNALRIIASTASSSEDAFLAQAVPKVLEAITSGKKSSFIIGLLGLSDVLIHHLKSRYIPYIANNINVVLPLTNHSSPIISKEAFTVLSALIDTVPTFINSKQLGSLLSTFVNYREKDAKISLGAINITTKKISTKILFPTILELWKGIQDMSVETIQGFFDLLRLTLKHADKTILPSLMKGIFAFFLEVFDLRHQLQRREISPEVINNIEESAIGSFLELVTKLSEASFKPLFVRLYDWAVIDLSEGSNKDEKRLVQRKIVLLHVMQGLLIKFRHLLSPYMSTLLPHIQELLQSYSTGHMTDLTLWQLLLSTLTTSFQVDASTFYTDKIHLELIPLLISQLSIPTRDLSDLLITSESPLGDCLAQLAKSTTSDTVLKALNTALCIKTRDDEVKVRMSALIVLDKVWETQAEEMLGLVPETVSEFLAELLEDENSDVERLTRGVLAKIEKMTGPLKEYLE
ncbi:hypothetical protein M231_03047 [Tremella mesenterica]|uniref:U3 small nucleolar RNA-associated protein 10 n=1 Tax=Tremella mesenterica TaxID=5217 RepID=A0A4Q1BPJ9_TREME|nr:hypothetical protein M231_03047 [Tremella mesenterica]